jgi:hypothetical protein
VVPWADACRLARSSRRSSISRVVFIWVTHIIDPY